MFWRSPEMEPSLSSELAPSRKPEQMSRMTRRGALATLFLISGTWSAQRR